MARLPYGRQSISEADIEAVVDCLRGDWLTQGPRVAELEAALCEVTGARHAVVVSSGTAALHLAVLSLGLGPGDVGVTSPITFVATANALRYVGAEAAFADVEPRTALLQPEALEALLSRLEARGTPAKVILPVDFAGQVPDLPRIRALGARFGAKVIEDAAHSLGASYLDGQQRHRVGEGAHADITTLSFHPVKHITTAEGGALLTQDEAVYRRALQLRSHGIHHRSEAFSLPPDDPRVGPWYYEQNALGFHYRLTDLQCALGLSQLRRLGSFLERRRALAAQYDLALKALSDVLLPLATQPGVEHAYHLYVVQLRRRPGESALDLAARRKSLFLFLRESDIYCQVHYVPVTWQPFHRTAPERACPGAEAYYAASLSLPLFPEMTDADVVRVAEAVRAWVARG